MRRAALLLATVLASSTLASVAFAADEEHDPIVQAVGELLHGPTPGTRDRARELLRQNPDAAVDVLLRALEEVAAARRPPVASATVEAPPALPVRADDHVVQIYDVRDLVERFGSCEELVRRLRGGLGEGSTMAAQGEGIIVVKTRPHSHEDLQQTLSGLRQDMSEMVRIETRVISAPLTALLGREVSASRPGDVVPIEDPVAALEAWIAAGDAEIVAAPALSCFPEQRASVHVGREISFVADFDVEIAQSAIIADPIVERIYAGVEIELTPTISAADIVRVDVLATCTDVALETFSTTLGAFEDPVEIQIPAMIRTEVRRAVDVPDGGTIVVRLSDDRDARRFVVLTVTRERLLDDE